MDSEPLEELHPTADPPDIRSFREWALADDVQDVIEGMGIEVPTPVQRLAIQPVLDGRDVIAKAETGTGKTLAFGAPMMSKIDNARASVMALVLCPTRELAQQVADVLAQLGEPRGVAVALIVGGDPLAPQVEALKAGAQVVVGTPGRVLDLMNQRFLTFPWTEFAVLDEADEMLEIGFIDDVKKILEATPDERQTMLFSATFPAPLLRLAREYTTNPMEIATAKGMATVDQIVQSFIEVEERDRELALIRLIEQSADDDIFLIFCDRRTEVDRLMRRLERLPYSIKALHGGYDQAARFRVMSAFRTAEVKALVATDVASRGLDVLHVTIVLNFSVPRDVSDYTHRIGRTGRAGRAGRAITLVSPLDGRRWREVRRGMPWNVEQAELPERQRHSERRDGRAHGGGRDGRFNDRDRSQRSSSRRDGEDRPRSGSRGGARGRRDEAPRPEQKPRPAKSLPTAEAPRSDAQAPRNHTQTDFGANVFGTEDPKRPKKPARPRRDDRPKQPRKPPEAPENPPNGDSGFGAGI